MVKAVLSLSGRYNLI